MVRQTHLRHLLLCELRLGILLEQLQLFSMTEVEGVRDWADRIPQICVAN